MVCKIFNGCQPHESRTAFDGMGCPENIVDQIYINVCAAFFNCQQIAFNVCQVIQRFFDIHL